jgi:hypothetical protein
MVEKGLGRREGRTLVCGRLLQELAPPAAASSPLAACQEPANQMQPYLSSGCCTTTH